MVGFATAWRICYRTRRTRAGLLKSEALQKIKEETDTGPSEAQESKEKGHPFPKPTPRIKDSTRAKDTEKREENLLQLKSEFDDLRI